MDNKDHQFFMESALQEARQSGGDVPVGAVLVKDGQIVARGRNQRELLNDPTAHAEIVAIREAAQLLQTWRLDGTTMYCTLEPCPMCAEALLQARVSQIVYGASDLVYGATGSAFNLYTQNRTYPLPEVVPGVLEEECRTLLKDYFKEQRARKLEKR